MRIHAARLPEGQCFACSRKAVKENFGEDKLDWVSFGAVRRTFEWEPACKHRPHLTGLVPAALTVARDRTAYMCLYRLSREHYSEAAQEAFAAKVLPHLSQWLKEKLARSETAIAGYEQIITEWTGTEHRFYEVRFL